MKRSPAILASIVLALSAGRAMAHNNSGGSGSSAPVAHSGSSAPAPAPAGGAHVSGVPHSASGVSHSVSGGMPYRATVTYHNGARTLNYPGVTATHIQHSTRSGGNNPNSPHSGGAKLTTTQRTVVQSSGGGGSQHAGAINLIGKHKLDPQTSARLRHWGGNISTTAQAHQNHLNNCQHHHNHHWWHDHCAAIIFWDWGWWGWDDGWWYPAWGYDPYSYYGYNEPIYGYEGLSPEQIVAGVQAALQERGYYSYAVDGQMGPMTKNAIARYQRDHHLPITYGIDPATLGSLGIIH